MRFLNEEDRRTHPQASLIPYPVWIDFFSPQLSDDVIELMQSRDETYVVSQLTRRTDDLIGQPTLPSLWLAMVYSREEIDINFCQRISSALQFSPQKQLMLAATLGDMGFFHASLTDAALPLIIAESYEVFRCAVRNGHLAIVEHILGLVREHAPHQLPAMMASNLFSVFRYAVKRNFFEVLTRLMQTVPRQLEDMVSAAEFDVFRAAAGNLHVRQYGPRMAYWLLNFPIVFAYAETKTEYMEHFVQPYSVGKITELRAKKQSDEAATPPVLFDIETGEAKLCFYILRNLIRRNSPDVLLDIHFLLSIPAVQAIAHTEVTLGEPNELLRLAKDISNSAAETSLLAIPAVRLEAAAHGFYRTSMVVDKSELEISLATLAADPESSVHALSPEQVACLGDARARYEPLIRAAAHSMRVLRMMDRLQSWLCAPNTRLLPNRMLLAMTHVQRSLQRASDSWIFNRGVAQTIEQLRRILKERYRAHPVTIFKDNGEEIPLPLEWDAFQRLTLTPAERTRAHQAFYQHKAHGAFRFLSIPNYWMHPDAQSVKEHPRNPRKKWAAFEEYQPLIAMLYLAVIDVEVPPTDGHSLETRFDHFVFTLADINRAHNWDSSRTVMRAGEAVLDTAGNPVPEEFDDGEADKPCCYSGMPQRFGQAVLGHPLLKVLTKSILQKEIRDFVRAHFTQSITESNRESLYDAWMSYISSLEETDADLLHTLDIPDTQQKAFLQSMHEKYGPKFDTTFAAQVEKCFTLKKGESHALKLDGLIDVRSLLLPPRDARVSQIGLFAAPACATGDDEERLDADTAVSSCTV